MPPNMDWEQWYHTSSRRDANCLYFPCVIAKREELLADWQGGAGSYIRREEIPQLLVWKEVHPGDRPPAAYEHFRSEEGSSRICGSPTTTVVTASGGIHWLSFHQSSLERGRLVTSATACVNSTGSIWDSTAQYPEDWNAARRQLNETPHSAKWNVMFLEDGLRPFPKASKLILL